MAVLPFPCLLSYFRPQDLLLPLPSPAVLEQLFPRLRPVLAPPAGRAVCILRPFQVLPSAAVPRSELVKASRQVLWRSLHHPVWPLVFCQLVFPSPDPLFSPAPCFAPLLLCYFPPQIGQGPGWGHPPYPVPIGGGGGCRSKRGNETVNETGVLSPVATSRVLAARRPSAIMCFPWVRRLSHDVVWRNCVSLADKL